MSACKFLDHGDPQKFNKRDWTLLVGEIDCGFVFLVEHKHSKMTWAVMLLRERNSVF